jgi:hypothetical protein
MRKHKIKAKRGRKPLPPEQHRKGMSITMTMPMWDALKLWMITTGARSRGRAVEALLGHVISDLAQKP